MGVFKLSVMVVFTDGGIYARLPGTKRDPVKRTAWPDRGFAQQGPHCMPTKKATCSTSRHSMRTTCYGARIRTSFRRR